MRVIDTVNKHLTAYPSLYLRKTWEESKFEILHHMFVVLGNGVEWAHTKDPHKGGYLTDPQSYKSGGEWKRKYDLPYGKETFKLNPKLFTEEIYEFGPISTNNPYPNFQKEYSCFWEPGFKYIQDDWRQAGYEHLLYWKNYFADDANTVDYHYRYKAKTVQEVIKNAKEGAKGGNWVAYLRKQWEWPTFDPNANDDTNAADHWADEKKKTLNFLDETLVRLQCD